MKKFISIIIILASLLLVSCASTTPVESAEPSWITSIISTTASAQEATTAATATAATAGTEATTAAPTPTTATETTKSEPVTPQTPFTPSGYTNYGNMVEMRSKVLFIVYNALYYSKADGELYYFCFDPFCDHTHKSQNCIARKIAFNYDAMGAHMFYLNSRVYFFNMGSLYSCSEFATDLRLELEVAHFSSIEDYAFRETRGGASYLFKECAGYGNYLFFDYIEPDGSVSWYRYDVVKRQKKKMDDDLHALEEKLGYTLVKNGITDGHIYFYAYDENEKFVGGYVSDFNLENVVKTEEKNEIYRMFFTANGIYCTDYNGYRKPGDITVRSSFDIVLLKPDGKVETIVKDAYGKMKSSNIVLSYINDDYIYYYNNTAREIGYEYNWHGYTEASVNSDGKVLRYNIKTGEVDVWIDTNGDDYFETFDIEYINEKDNVAVIYTMAFIDMDEVYDGKKVYKWINAILTCHLDSGGIVDSFEAIDQDEI